eukprot:3067000-Rhodomonas_salina.9
MEPSLTAGFVGCASFRSCPPPPDIPTITGSPHVATAVPLLRPLRAVASAAVDRVDSSVGNSSSEETRDPFSTGVVIA